MNDCFRCQRCGSKIPQTVLGGLCPRCVGRRLLADDSLPTPRAAGTSPIPAGEAPATVRLSRYKLLEELGEGGCGIVYSAEQDEPVHRRVALKVIKPGMDSKAVIARFEAERQALALMDHPNIARIFDAGATPAGRLYFVMELAQGPRITEYCDQRQLDLSQRIELFITVCQAVQHAHQKGIIHRDLKPSNILIVEPDGAPVPKIIDFGIAKATDQQLTNATLVTELHHFLGTPAYMSPEQAGLGGRDIDTRSDIYSLGVLLYELLTGRTPFDGKELLATGLDEMRRTIREVEPVKPSTRLTEELAKAGKWENAKAGEATVPPSDSPSRGFPPDHVQARPRPNPHELQRLSSALRGDLDWIVMKCLEKDRARRYESASDLALDLVRYLNHEPVTAAAQGAIYKLGKFARRNRVAFATAAAMLFVLLLATGFSTWQAIRASRAEGFANRQLIDSEKAREDAEAIAKFLTDVFQSPDPARQGRAITVEEALGRAVQKTDQDLAEQPERRAKLQATLGNTYRALGIYREAIGLQEKVLAYRRSQLGSEHPNTLDAMHELAQSYDDATRWQEALDLREQIIAVRQMQLGPAHPKTLLAQSHLAWSHNLLKHTQIAVQMETQILDASRRINGPEHPDTILAMSYLGWFYSTGQRSEEALELQSQAVALITKRVGREHPDTLNAITVLAVSENKTGHRDEAIKHQQELLVLSRKLKGSLHPETLWVMDNLAVAYREAGRANEALQTTEELLTFSRQANGPTHGRTLKTMQQLISDLRRVGRNDEATELSTELASLKRQSAEPARTAVDAHARVARE